MLVQVLSVSSSPVTGAVTSVALVRAGSGYQVGKAATIGGSGTGLIVYIPVINLGEGAAIGTIQYLWQVMFGGTSRISISDGGSTATFSGSTVMTANVTVGFGSLTSTAITALTVNGYMVPRPQGVTYSYTIAGLPEFGFDSSTGFVSGFDVGFFS
jgi:hypothetical protein